MMPVTLERYQRLRTKGWSAAEALRYAKVKSQFDKLEDAGFVRFRVVEDNTADMDDLKGDSFNPDVNTDIPRSRLAREEKEFEERVGRDGVWGILGQYRSDTDGEWDVADSVWGFVGEDWQESGYDTDVMAGTIAALVKDLRKRRFCPHCKRPY